MPIVGPCIGAVLGVLIYELLVEVHHPPLSSESRTSGQEAPEEKGVELEGVEPEGGKPV